MISSLLLILDNLSRSTCWPTFEKMELSYDIRKKSTDRCRVMGLSSWSKLETGLNRNIIPYLSVCG